MTTITLCIAPSPQLQLAISAKLGRQGYWDRESAKVSCTLKSWKSRKSRMQHFLFTQAVQLLQFQRRKSLLYGNIFEGS